MTACSESNAGTDADQRRPPPPVQNRTPPGITAAAVTVTAEARVLDVGGARLTPSMLGQLDETAWDETAPIGRVRPPGADPAFTDVIGASARAWDRGALVRSVLPAPALAASLADGGPPPGPEAAEWRGYLLGLDPAERPAVVAAAEVWAALPLILLAEDGGRAP